MFRKLLIIGLGICLILIAASAQTATETANCNNEIVKYQEWQVFNIEQKDCTDIKVCDTKNLSCKVGDSDCRITYTPELRLVTTVKTVCMPYEETPTTKLDYGKQNMVCTKTATTITCDLGCYQDKNGQRQCSDGNGDGKCQPGETCYIYDIATDITLIQYSNGAAILTDKTQSKVTVK